MVGKLSVGRFDSDFDYSFQKAGILLHCMSRAHFKLCGPDEDHNVKVTKVESNSLLFNILRKQLSDEGG